MARRDIPYAGILVPDARLRTAGAASTIQETGTTTTSYQQAGPTAPGAVDVGSGVVLALSGNQAEPVFVNVGRGGAPDPARGARLRWADSSTDPLQGWAPPTWVEYVTGGGGLTASEALDLIPLSTGQVAIVAADGAPARTRSALYTPSTDTLTVKTDLPWVASVGALPTTALLALWQDPDDDAIYALQSDATGAAGLRHMLVKSTDLMTTWTTVAQAAFTGGAVQLLCRKARWFRLASGAHVLITMDASSLRVWSSTSGEDWRLIGELGNLAEDVSGKVPAADVVLLPDGRLLYAYIEDAVSDTVVRVRLADALQDPSTAAVIDVATTTGANETVCLCLEETGRAWIFAHEVSQGVRVYRSLDYQQWATDTGLQWANNGDHLEQPFYRAIQLEGGHLIAMASSTNTPPVFVRAGGWTNVEPWFVSSGRSAQDADRLTWGAADTAAIPWQGQTAVQNLGLTVSSYWTRTNSGTNTETTSAIRRRISTTGGTRFYTTTISLGDSVTAFLDVDPDTGGSSANAEIAWEVQQVFSVTARMRYTCRLYTGVGQMARLVDYTGAVVATLDIDPTRVQFLYVAESSNRLEVYYRLPGAHVWTSWYQTATPAIDTSVASGLKTEVKWGNIDSGTAISDWRFVAVASNDFASKNQTAKRDQWRSTASTAAQRTAVLGRPLAALPGSLGNPVSYPAVSLLTVVPTGGGVQTIEPAHAYPVDHLDSISSPSPRQVWRSTSNAEQVLEWYLDPTVSSADLTYYGVYLAGANFREAVLEYWDGAAWRLWVGVDLGEALNFTRAGNTLEAASGSPRWLKQHEAVGAYVDLTGGTRRRVQWNSTGYGTADGTRARLRLTGVTGADPASGNGTLVHTRGVAASLAQVTAQRVRLRIPAQVTPEGYFELGAFAIGRIYALGAPLDFGSGQSTLIDVQEEQAPGYATRSRRSPPRRRWSLSIAEANVKGIRDGVAGYLAADGAPNIGIGLEGDVAPLLEGLLAQGIDASPVLVLPAPPETEDATTDHTTTETRRDVLWWGRVSSVQWDNITGELGAGELQRVSTVTIEEDV
jgi:hypothetical protein